MQQQFQSNPEKKLEIFKEQQNTQKDEYFPLFEEIEEEKNPNECDVVLSNSENVVDSRGSYCSISDLDYDTNCCVKSNEY